MRELLASSRTWSPGSAVWETPHCAGSVPASWLPDRPSICSWGRLPESAHCWGRVPAGREAWVMPMLPRSAGRLSGGSHHHIMFGHAPKSLLWCGSAAASGAGLNLAAAWMFGCWALTLVAEASCHSSASQAADCCFWCLQTEGSKARLQLTTQHEPAPCGHCRPESVLLPRSSSSKEGKLPLLPQAAGSSPSIAQDESWSTCRWCAHMVRPRRAGLAPGQLEVLCWHQASCITLQVAQLTAARASTSCADKEHAQSLAQRVKLQTSHLTRLGSSAQHLAESRRSP